MFSYSTAPSHAVLQVFQTSSVGVFQTLPDSAVSTYAASLRDKGSLVPALYKVIRENYSDVSTHYYTRAYVNIRDCSFDLVWL